jgi:hypothetical protein
MESWKDIPGYEGLYQVSNLGRIKSLGSYRRGEMIIKQRKWKGYWLINLSKEDQRKTFLVHRLVAICFVENPHSRKIVNHKDGNKANNYYENLEWSTTAENTQHAYDNHLIPSRQGINNPNSKFRKTLKSI